MAWTVTISPLARDQVWEQVRFISRHSARNALIWESRVIDAMRGLADAPTHTEDVRASKRMRETLYKVVFERTYLIFYRVDAAASVIEIVSFRHGARLPRRYEP